MGNFIQLGRDEFRQLIAKVPKRIKANARAAWIELLLRANYQAGYKDGVYLERGQLFCGREEMAEAIGLSEQEYRTVLKCFKNLSELTSNPTSEGTILTIAHYDDYVAAENGSNQRPNQQVTSKQPAANHSEEVNKQTSTPLGLPTPPLGACTREEDLSGEELDGEKIETINGQTAQITLAFRFARMPTTEQRTQVKKAGFAYDGQGTWSAPWSSARQALVEQLRPYLATDAATVPSTPTPALVTPPAADPAPGAATAARSPSATAPAALPATPAHLQPVLDWIRGQVRSRSWESWFRPEVMALAGDSLHLEILVASNVAAEWVPEHYTLLFQRACEEALGRVPTIEVRVPGATARASPPGGPPASEVEPAAHSTLHTERILHHERQRKKRAEGSR